MKSILLSTLAALVLATAAGASEVGHDLSQTVAPAPVADMSGFGVGVGVSTLGLTVEPTYRINDSFGVRMPIGGGSFSDTFEEDGDSYTGSVESFGGGVLVDYYTGLGGLRLSGGAFHTDYKADLAASTTINGMTGDIAVAVKQRENWAPSAALGYDMKLGRRGVLSADAGAIFGKGFDVTGSSRSFSQADVDAELADLSETAGDLKVLPYVKLTVGLSF